MATTKLSRKRTFVGIKSNKTAQTFDTDVMPDKSTHPQYKTVKGPFKTKRAASYMANHDDPSSMSDKSIADIESLAAALGINPNDDQDDAA